jgi:hypothetical protein
MVLSVDGGSFRRWGLVGSLQVVRGMSPREIMVRWHHPPLLWLLAIS